MQSIKDQSACVLYQAAAYAKQQVNQTSHSSSLRVSPSSRNDCPNRSDSDPQSDALDSLYESSIRQSTCRTQGTPGRWPNFTSAMRY
jgi:hypothetical protein